MPDPNVYEVAHLKDADDALITFGVDYDFVTIDCGRVGTGGGFRLNRAQAELFAQYFVHACWSAAPLADEDGAPLDGFVSDPSGISGPGVHGGI